MVKPVESTQNKRLVIFLQYIKKKVSQMLFCSIVMENIQIFYVQSCLLLLFYFKIGTDTTMMLKKTSSNRYYTRKQLNNTKTKKDMCFQPAFTWSKLTIETLEQGVKYAQS